MLKDCIAKAGKLLSPTHADRMLARTSALIAEGIDPGKAEITAINELLAEVTKERTRLAIPLRKGVIDDGQEEKGREVLIPQFKSDVRPVGGPIHRATLERIDRLGTAQRNLDSLEARRSALKDAGKPTAEIDREIRKVWAADTELPDLSDGRASLGEVVDPKDVQAEIDALRSEYPSAPNFVIETSPKGTDPQQGAAYLDDGEIHVYPGHIGSRRQARSALLGALAEAGAELYSPSFWDKAYALAVTAERPAIRRLSLRHNLDVSKPEGRRTLMALLMTEVATDRPSSLARRLVRWVRGTQSRELSHLLTTAFRNGLEQFKPKTALPISRPQFTGRRFTKGVGFETQSFPTEAEARTFAGPDGVVRDVTQEQSFADIHRAWYRTLAPALYRLRRAASEIGLTAAEDAQWRGLERHMRRLTEEAETRLLGATPLVAPLPRGRPRVDVEADEFPEQYTAAMGRELSDRDLDAWARYRAELRARRAVAMLDRLDDLSRTRDSLRASEPRWYDPAHPEYGEFEEDRKRFDRQISRLAKRVAKFPTDIRARADELRARRHSMAEAEAARRVLEDPFWVETADIVDRVDESGVTPRALDDLSPNARNAAEALRNAFHHSYQGHQESLAVRSESERSKVEATLRRLRDRLRTIRSDAGAAEVAVKEVRDALAGEHGTSGTLASRDIATAFRDLDTAIQRFAISLARARPDTPVWELRELVQAYDPAVPLDAREEYRRTLADAMGLSVDAFSRILDLIQRYGEFRSGILAMHDAAERASTDATITAIEDIERHLAAGTEDDIRKAQDIGRRTIARLTRVWKTRNAAARSLGEDIAAALVDLRSLDMAVESAAAPVADPGYVRQMVYPTSDGEYLAPFFRPDGTEQPGVAIRPGKPFTEDVLRAVVEWRNQAVQAVAAGTEINDPETIRGLQVAIVEPTAGVSKYIDLWATPKMRGRVLAPGSSPLTGGGAMTLLATHPKTGLKSLLPNLLPGPQANRLREAGALYTKAAEIGDRILDNNIATERRLVLAAANSLGIDIQKPGQGGRFYAAYNEVAHRLRQFESGVAPGDMLWSEGIRGLEVTPELLTLLRWHRDIFREAQSELALEPYGGVRMRRRGRRLIRPFAETGDVGLGRFANKDHRIALAAAYREGRDNPAAIPAFWNSDPDAVLFHVLDSTRNDLGAERDEVLLRAEQEAAREIRRMGRSAALPTTLDEWADYLGRFVSGVPAASTYAREKLLEELSQYGNLAMSQIPADPQSPINAAGRYFGENDVNEFNSPAAKLLFPSSWYTYGAGDGFRAAIERTLDRRQVEYFDALLQAKTDLIARADALSQAIQRIGDSNEVPEEFKDDILWHTAWWGGSETWKTRRRASSALELMRARANNIDNHYAALAGHHASAVDPLSRALSHVVPFTLSSYSAAITNIVGGPIRAFTILRPMVGATAAAIDLGIGLPLSLLSVGYDSLIDALPAPISKLLKNRGDMLSYQLSRGLGLSYGREEMAELNQWASGMPPANKAWEASLQAAGKVSDLIGVRRGDQLLNRYGARWLVPQTMWFLRTIAESWRNRVGESYDPLDETTLLSEPDVRIFGPIKADLPHIRRILSSIGRGSPEEVLSQLLAEDVNPRLFWRTAVGRAVGDWALNEFNVATRLNRPDSSFLGFLMGWVTSATGALVEDAQRPADEGAIRRLGGKAVWVTAAFLTALTFGAAQQYARQAANEGVSALVTSLAGMLAPTPDDDDEPGMVDWVFRVLSKVVASLQNRTIRKPLPTDPGFWKNPGPDAELGTADDVWRDKLDIAGKLLATASSGYGLDLQGARLPGISIVSQLVEGALQSGRGVGLWAEGKAEKDRSLELAGNADIREGLRQVSGLFGLFGRVPFNTFFHEDQKGRESRQRILNAATDAGITPVTPLQPGGIMPAQTPVQRDLQEAGRRIVDGDPTAVDDAKAIAGFIRQRSYDRAIRDGNTPEAANKAADAAVKRTLSSLDPYESALGRTLTKEQYRKLKESVGNNAAVLRDEAAAKAVVDAISKTPPTGMRPFVPSPSMTSPLRSESGGGRRGGRRLSSVRFGRRGRLGRQLATRRRRSRLRWA